MKPGWGSIDAARIGETVESLKDVLVQPTSRALVELQAMLTGGLTFTDNVKCAIIKRDLVHGLEQPITLGFKPIGVYALRSEAVGANVRYAVESLDWRMDAPGGTIGVTARYAAPVGGIELTRTSATIANATDTAVTWDIERRKFGNLTHSNTVNPARVVCEKAGIVLPSFGCYFAASAVGERFIWVSKNGVTGFAGSRWGEIRGNASAGDHAIISTQPIEVAAGDYIEARAYQTSGGALNVLGNAIGESLFSVEYIKPPSTATNTVTLLCVGG